jgi:hypothetical protein
MAMLKLVAEVPQVQRPESTAQLAILAWGWDARCELQQMFEDDEAL